MTTRALLLGSLLVAFAIPACGGAIDPGTSSSGSSGASGATGPGSPSSPTTPPEPPSPAPLPPSTAPGSFNTTASGCANFTVFAGDTSGRRFLIVQADKNELGLAALGDTRTVDLATKGSSTKVFVDTYDRVPREQMYCADSISEPYNPTRTTAVQALEDHRRATGVRIDEASARRREARLVRWLTQTTGAAVTPIRASPESVALTRKRWCRSSASAFSTTRSRKSPRLQCTSTTCSST